MTAVNGPLNYINGRRVESANTNTEDDIKVLEPATGWSFLLIFATVLILILILV